MRIPRKRGLPYNELMQLISEEVRAARTPVAVIDPKERALGPFIVSVVGGAIRRLVDVQDDRDAVLVVATNDALVGVHGVA